MKSTFIFVVLAALASAAELGIDITQEYICERPTKKGDTIDVHYTGTLTNGKKFDSSVDRGTPFSFTLGAGQVIKGWDQGLLDMCVGDKRTLTVPPEFGYGNRNMGPIPGGSTLIFTTELMGIRGAPKEMLVPKPSASESSATEEAASSETSSSSLLSTSESVESKQITTVPAESATPETPETSATTEPKQTTTIPGDAAKATETENKDEL